MEQITSLTNQKIKHYIKLRDDQKFRNEKKEFVIEGIHTVNEALKRNAVKTLFFTSNVKSFFDFDNKILIADHVSEKMTSTKKSQNVFAICEMIESEVNFEKNILILDEIKDPGNMGTLIRSAASFDFTTVLASKTSVSFYNEKVVRSTQGNLFSLSLINCDLISKIKTLKSKDYMILGTVLNNESIELSSLKIEGTKKFALIIGNEANGMNDELKKMIDLNINIEMSNEVESLNAAIAGSIIMYNLKNKK